MRNRFNFTGTFTAPKETAKRPFCKAGTTKNNHKSLSMNFGIKASNNNMGFVEAFDFERDTIKTMNTENEKIEIDWKDRFDEEVVKSVAHYKKYIVDLGEEYGGRNEFITLYDAICFLQERLPLYSGNVTVIGELIKDWYNGKYTDRFKFQSVYAANEDAKPRLSLLIDIYYNKTSIDKSEFKDSQKLFLNGYIEQYINADEGTKFFPHQFVFCTSKYDLENNPTHKKQYDYKMKFIDIAKKTMQHLLWEVVLLRGAEEVEFDESMLTDMQLEQIELGFKTLDDFKPRGNIFGNRLCEYRLKIPALTGDFVDGMLDTEIKESEFEESIHIPVAQEQSIEDAKNSANDVSKDNDEAPFDDVGEDDLF